MTGNLPTLQSQGGVETEQAGLFSWVSGPHIHLHGGGGRELWKRRVITTTTVDTTWRHHTHRGGNGDERQTVWRLLTRELETPAGLQLVLSSCSTILFQSSNNYKCSQLDKLTHFYKIIIDPSKSLTFIETK